MIGDVEKLLEKSMGVNSDVIPEQIVFTTEEKVSGEGITIITPSG